MILAIETSDLLCSVAYWDKDRTLLEYNLELPMQHAALVGQLVNDGLAFLGDNAREQKFTPDDLELVAVSLGPGSFTGLRIGLSFAQGFCFGKELPIVGVSNHQILARQRLLHEDQLFTLIEARRDEVYIAEHDVGESLLTKLKKHEVVTKGALPEIIPAGAQVVIKKDLSLTVPVINALRENQVQITNNARYSASLLAEISQLKFQRDGADDLAELEPLYIRPFAGVL